jgi:hypothetical protein
MNENNSENNFEEYKKIYSSKNDSDTLLSDTKGN